MKAEEIRDGLWDKLPLAFLIDIGEYERDLFTWLDDWSAYIVERHEQELAAKDEQLAEMKEAFSTALDYMLELHRYLWRVVRAVKPGAYGDLYHFLDDVVEQLEAERDQEEA